MPEDVIYRISRNFNDLFTLFTEITPLEKFTNIQEIIIKKYWINSHHFFNILIDIDLSKLDFKDGIWLENYIKDKNWKLIDTIEYG